MNTAGQLDWIFVQDFVCNSSRNIRSEVNGDPCCLLTTVNRRRRLFSEFLAARISKSARRSSDLTDPVLCREREL